MKLPPRASFGDCHSAPEAGEQDFGALLLGDARRREGNALLREYAGNEQLLLGQHVRSVVSESGVRAPGDLRSAGERNPVLGKRQGTDARPRRGELEQGRDLVPTVEPASFGTLTVGADAPPAR